MDMKQPSDPAAPGTPPAPSSPSGNRKTWRRGLALLATLLALVVLTALFGGGWLDAPDPLPEHADVAVALAGSDTANVIRLGAAVQMLEEGRVDRVIYHVAPLNIWGQFQPDVVRRFLDREYPRISGKILLCEGMADSTLEEARLLYRCLQRRPFDSVIVVTSNFHTRRTRMIWRSQLSRHAPEGVQLSVHGVLDGSFESDGWWRNRRYAKTWLFEATKMGWYLVESLFQPA
jgi:hypothetical protein